MTFDCAGADAGMGQPKDDGGMVVVPKEDGGIIPAPTPSDAGHDGGVQDGGVGGSGGGGSGCSALPGSQSFLLLAMSPLALRRARAKKN